MPPFLSLIPIQEEVNINIYNNLNNTNNIYIPVNRIQLNQATKNVREQNKTEINISTERYLINSFCIYYNLLIFFQFNN